MPKFHPNLIIDDTRTLPLPEYIYATYARNYEQGIAILFDDPDRHWNTVYLDHDLGSTIPNHTGYDIAARLEREAYMGTLYNVDQFVIISANSVGRRKIYEALYKHYNVRFMWVEE